MLYGEEKYMKKMHVWYYYPDRCWVATPERTWIWRWLWVNNYYSAYKNRNKFSE